MAALLGFIKESDKKLKQGPALNEAHIFCMADVVARHTMCASVIPFIYL